MFGIDRDGIDKVELRAEREDASMAWVLTRALAELLAAELHDSGWSVSFEETVSPAN
jgi:hypothetical protein